MSYTAHPEAVKDDQMRVQAALPETGFLRLRDIIGRPATKSDPAIPAVIPVSASTWWAGVKSGRYPQPTRALGVRITAWRVEDIRALIEANTPKAAA